MAIPALEMERIAADQPSKSAKIRALHAAGYSRSQIADFVGVRYQFVRNVLVDEERRKQSRNAEPVSGDASGVFKVRVDADGQIAIPLAFREALGLKPGDTLVAALEQDHLALLTIPAAVRKAQAIVRKFVPAGAGLVDELLDDRRREAERDDHE